MKIERNYDRMKIGGNESEVQDVRHARFLTDKFGFERAICSLCGAVYEGGDSFNYCPKCGAKIDREDKDDEN